MPWVNQLLREALAEFANGTTPEHFAALEHALRETDELVLHVTGVNASHVGTVQTDGTMGCETTDHPQAGSCVLVYVDRQAGSASLRDGVRPAGITPAGLATMAARIRASVMLVNPEGTHPDGPDWCILPTETLCAIAASRPLGMFQRAAAAIARVFGGSA